MRRVLKISRVFFEKKISAKFCGSGTLTLAGGWVYSERIVITYSGAEIQTTKLLTYILQMKKNLIA
jgi:hypothetical protein